MRRPSRHDRRRRGQALTEFVLILGVSLTIAVLLSKIGFSRMNGIYERERLVIARQFFLF